MCQIKTEDVIQPYNVIIMHSVCVWKICKWIETSDNYLANKMHLAWWICRSWSKNADIDPGGGSAPHEGLMLFWIPRLSVPVIIIYEQTTWRCWDDLITLWKAQKIHHRTKLAMFTTPAQTQDCVFSWLVCKSYTWVLSDCYIHIASGDFCLYNVTKSDCD